MGTTARVFYANGGTTNWDGTDPAGGDVIKLLAAQPANDTSNTDTQLSFPTTAPVIVVDPNTTRSTTGAADQNKFGWAINLAGGDGMEGQANGQRRIPPGVWDFVTYLSTLTATTSNYKVRASVYRISADGLTRTLLFASNESAQATLVIGFNLHSFSSASQPEFLFGANETLLVSYLVNKINSTLAGEEFSFRAGRTSVAGTQTNVCTVTVPSPGTRTFYEESITVAAVGTASLTDGTSLVTGIVYDSTGAVVSGATVKLFNQTTDAKISERASGVDGSYTFTRTDVDTGTYYTVGFSDATHHGTSDRDLSAT